MLSIKGNLIVLLKLALNCKLWTENNLPSLNGIKAIDNRVYTIGTECHSTLLIFALATTYKYPGAYYSVPTNHIAPGPSFLFLVTSYKQQATSA